MVGLYVSEYCEGIHCIILISASFWASLIFPEPLNSSSSKLLNGMCVNTVFFEIIARLLNFNINQSQPFIVKVVRTILGFETHV